MMSVTYERCPSHVDLNLVFPLDQTPLGQPAAARCGVEAAILGGDAFGRFGDRGRLVLQIIPLDLPIPSSSITSSSMFN